MEWWLFAISSAGVPSVGQYVSVDGACAEAGQPADTLNIVSEPPMQVINDLGMMFVAYLRGGDPRSVFNVFTVIVESVSAAAGVVLAIAFTQQSLAFFVLLLAVLATGMLVIMQYALMRYRLERIVEDRTRELRDQALEFERQATHDKLTRLPNRRYADDYLQQQIDLAQRSRAAGAVALGEQGATVYVTGRTTGDGESTSTPVESASVQRSVVGS